MFLGKLLNVGEETWGVHLDAQYIDQHCPVEPSVTMDVFSLPSSVIVIRHV